MTSIISAVRAWADMVKFSHTVFALPFALIAAFLAGRGIEDRGWPYLGQLALIVICMVGGRSFAMTFNRIVDARIDAGNPRTSGRPLPAGRLTFLAAWIMLLLSAGTFGAGSLGFHLFYGNTWPILFSGPVLIYLGAYSFTKRFTKWSHYYLGSAIALAPVAAWVAVDPHTLGAPAWLLMATVMFWIAGFDIIYACQDIPADRRDGLYSLPSRLGPAVALRIARVSHVLTVLGLIALGFTANLGWIYGIGVVLAAGLLTMENALVSPGDYHRVTVAFFTMNGLVSLVLAAAAITDIFVSASM